MKKNILVSVIVCMLVASLGAMGGCQCTEPKTPQGSVAFVLDSIESNGTDITMDSINVLKLFLKESDKTYKVSFQAKGMPVFSVEEGVYEINGPKISFTRNSGGNLISEGLSYSAEEGKIKISCPEGRNSDKTYNAILKRVDVVYSLQSITQPNDANVSAGDFEYYTISLNAMDKTYVATFRAKGMPPQVPSPRETGSYEISGSVISFTRDEAGSHIISKGLSYDFNSDTIGIEGRNSEGKTFNAILVLDEEATK